MFFRKLITGVLELPFLLLHVICLPFAESHPPLSKDHIRHIIKTASSGDEKILSESNDTLVVRKKVSDVFLISLTFPTVYEVYFEAEHLSSAIKVENWSDYYGETFDQDYEEHIKVLFDKLKSSEFRLSKDQRDLECFYQGRWVSYFND